MFGDRAGAGRELAAALDDFAGQNPVVLGIPRGGVIVAAEIARAIGGELDIVLTGKLGAPGNSEAAIGAVTEGGHVFLSSLAGASGVDREYIKAQSKLVLAEIDRRRTVYRALCPPVRLEGRIAIITDDGVATGSTMQAALWAAKRERPRLLIAAIPVAPPETLDRLAETADQVICLWTPPYFEAVSQFYERFDQTQDSELLEVLRRHIRRSTPDETIMGRDRKVG